MDAYVSEALDLAEKKEAEAAQRHAGARKLYVGCLLRGAAPAGGAAALRAAMDELRFGAAELRHDSAIAAAVRTLREASEKATKEQLSSQAASAELKAAVKVLRWDDPGASELLRQASAAERVAKKAEATLEVLRLSMKSCVSKGPRLFPDGRLPVELLEESIENAPRAENGAAQESTKDGIIEEPMEGLIAVGPGGDELHGAAATQAGDEIVAGAPGISD
jgi:hypothetical protein